MQFIEIIFLNEIIYRRPIFGTFSVGEKIYFLLLNHKIYILILLFLSFLNIIKNTFTFSFFVNTKNPIMIKYEKKNSFLSYLEIINDFNFIKPIENCKKWIPLNLIESSRFQDFIWLIRSRFFMWRHLGHILWTS